MLASSGFLRTAIVSATILAAAASGALAREVTINVWAGGSGPNDNYRVDAIAIAADLLEREAAIRGEELKIDVKGRTTFDSWDAFKQAVTLAAEAGTAPQIVVTGHEDIAPWSQAGIIVPIEDYIDLNSWPVSDIYPNLLKIASFGGVVYGLPQDAESRPFFFWRDHMRAIGYSDEQIDALPTRITAGDYTLQNVLEDAKKMQDAGVVKPGYGFYPRVSNGPDYWQFYVAFGGKMEENGKLVFDREAMRKYYQFFADAVAMGVTRKNHLGTPWDQWYSEVANGKAGLWHGGTWHYARYTGKEGNKDFFGTIQFSLIPAGDSAGTPTTLTHPLVYLVTNQADDGVEEIASQLVQIASEPRINALHAIKSAHLGIAKAESQIDLYANDRWASEATKRLLPHAIAMPNNVDFGSYWQVMWKGLEAAWTGAKTPEDAVKDAEAELRATLGDRIEIR